MLNKSSCLAPALGVAKLTHVRDKLDLSGATKLTEFTELIVTNFVTPKAPAKSKILFIVGRQVCWTQALA